MKQHKNTIGGYSRKILSGLFEGIKTEKGQTLVEYGLLLVLIAVVVIFAVMAVGQTANKTYSTINSGVSTAAS